MNVVLAGFLGSLAAGLMTAFGALPILAGRTIPRQFNDILLGFAAGIMLSASFFSLIIPALEVSQPLYGRGLVPPALVSTGIAIGAIAIYALDKAVPHKHFIKGYEGPKAESIKRIWLFVLAITLHNIPEGLAVGVGFGSANYSAATSLAIGIGLQNAPEGLAVALALKSEGYSKAYAFIVASLSGLVEPAAGVIGGAAVSTSQLLLPWGLSFAAGAMVYVISSEIIPETHQHGHHKAATGGLIVGLVLMMMLDVTFSQ